MKQKNKNQEEKLTFLGRLKEKSRLSIIDPNTFEERKSFLVSPLNLLIIIAFTLLVFVVCTWFIIAYSPLKQFIPGYPNLANQEQQKIQDIETLKMLDSIQTKASTVNQYNKNLLQILNEQNPEDLTTHLTDSLLQLDSSNLKKIDFTKSDLDSNLRIQVARNEKYALNYSENEAKTISENISGVFFFPPLKGNVTSKIDVKNGHFGIDIQAKKDETVKNTLDGTVVYAGWSSEDGHVVQVQHAHNLVSVYKHNSFLLVKQGEVLKSGDPIAIVGNSGSLSQGTHLHFELWYGGTTLDPLLYMEF